MNKKIHKNRMLWFKRCPLVPDVGFIHKWHQIYKVPTRCVILILVEIICLKGFRNHWNENKRLTKADACYYKQKSLNDDTALKLLRNISPQYYTNNNKMFLSRLLAKVITQYVIWFRSKCLTPGKVSKSWNSTSFNSLKGIATWKYGCYFSQPQRGLNKLFFEGNVLF